MKKNSISYARVLNYVCIVLMLLLLVTQFLPFFECPSCEDGTASVSDYVWFPDHHKDITKVMKSADLYGKKFEVSQVVLTPIVILAGCVLGIIFTIKNGGAPINAIYGLIAGGFGVVGYLTTPGLQIGQNWVLHLAASALVLVCALVVLSEPVLKLIKKASANKQ